MGQVAIKIKLEQVNAAPQQYIHHTRQQKQRQKKQEHTKQEK